MYKTVKVPLLISDGTLINVSSH